MAAPGPIVHGLDAEGLAAARDELNAGRCVVVPTDTVYGVAARIGDAGAIAALFDIKGRPVAKPMAVLVDSVVAATGLATFDRRATALAERYWPGPLTLVLDRRPGVATNLGGDPSTIGLRCPGLAPLRELARTVGPLVTTSANPSGEATLETAEEIVAAFGDRVRCVLDGGRLRAAASTVVDARAESLIVLREGPITGAELDAFVSTLP